MKTISLIFLLMVSRLAFADSLPVFSLQPTNQTVFPGSTATLVSSATGAAGYQWRFNGADIAGATSAMLQVVNVRPTNSGYYNVIAKNSTGWVPSQLAYLTLDYTYGGTVPSGAGTLPFSNTNNIYTFGQVMGPPTSGSVQIVAGPELDQLKPVGRTILYGSHPGTVFVNGYYNAADQSVSTIAPGQMVYYSVVYTNNGVSYPQPSTIMNLNAGTNGSPAPPAYGLKYPAWPEWPEPWLYYQYPTNQLRVPGEQVSFLNNYNAYLDFGIPTVQWRKDGKNILNATNFTWVFYGGSAQSVFTITNLQPSDTGVYDAEIFGNDWEDGPKIYLSVQTTNGQGVFQNPQFNGTNFVWNLLGAAGRNYDIQCSSNLVNWSDLVTLSNLTGTILFTNPPGSVGAQFYRTVLLP
jgi:hypothetical protein